MMPLRDLRLSVASNSLEDEMPSLTSSETQPKKSGFLTVQVFDGLLETDLAAVMFWLAIPQGTSSLLFSWLGLVAVVLVCVPLRAYWFWRSWFIAKVKLENLLSAWLSLLFMR